MNINSYFLDADITEEEIKHEEFNRELYKMVNNNYLDMLQYTYFLDFYKKTYLLINTQRYS